ncbi:hypothetical protein JL49_13470 [Pseudoalteromonas luteoviolacea]|nr:hypothetical protein JL49_13470 [Pseudoalteromonas luteoviolacea]
MFNELERNLLSMIEHIMIAYIILWGLYIAIFRRIDSYSVVLTVFVLFSSLMTVATPYLYVYAKSSDGIMHKAVWHLFFIVIFIAEIKIISVMHKSFRIKIKKLPLIFAIGLAAQAGLHIIRLLEKSLFETNYTAGFYTEGINIVNLMFVFLSILCIILAANRNYQLDKKCV